MTAAWDSGAAPAGAGWLPGAAPPAAVAPAATTATTTSPRAKVPRIGAITSLRMMPPFQDCHVRTATHGTDRQGVPWADRGACGHHQDRTPQCACQLRCHG